MNCHLANCGEPRLVPATEFSHQGRIVASYKSGTIGIENGISPWMGRMTAEGDQEDITAQATEIHIVDQIAKTWPRPGVRRRNRKAVDNFERARAAT